MGFFFDLDKQQAEIKRSRSQRTQRWFWSIGLILVLIQAIVIVRFALPSEKPTQKTTQSITVTSESIAFTLSTVSPLPKKESEVKATLTPKPTNTPLPTQTPAVVPPTPTMPSTGLGQLERDSELSVLFPPERVIDQSFQLAGQGPPGTTIDIILSKPTDSELVDPQQSILARAAVDAQGYWQATLPTAPLVRGENQLELRAPRQSGQLTNEVSLLIIFAPWWLETQTRLQAALGAGYACAPTVLGMAMDYYANSEPETMKTPPTTVQIVQDLEKMGFISGYGADAQMICNLAIAYGYSHSHFYAEWSQSHLRQELGVGHPIIANVRVGLSTDGYGHSVLVIGLSPDGERIMILDPEQGMVEALWSQFERSWSSFGPPFRHGTVVKP